MQRVKCALIGALLGQSVSLLLAVLRVLRTVHHLTQKVVKLKLLPLTIIKIGSILFYCAVINLIVEKTVFLSQNLNFMLSSNSSSKIHDSQERSLHY